MIGRDVASVDGQPERSRADIEKNGGFGEVDPGVVFVRLIARDAVMATQGSDSLACPAVTAAGEVTVTVQDAGDDVIA